MLRPLKPGGGGGELVARQLGRVPSAALRTAVGEVVGSLDRTRRALDGTGTGRPLTVPSGVASSVSG